jgi:prepilin-type N-terminal cleavage/methylation domain-containing protein
MRKDNRGFTLVEVLTVALIVSVLAAIAIPVFLNQRIRAWEGQQQSSLKDAGIAIETLGIDAGGSYESLDELEGCCVDGTAGKVLAEGGFRFPEYWKGSGYIHIEASTETFCIEARHAGLLSDSEWMVASVQHSSGSVPAADPDDCPEL